MKKLFVDTNIVIDLLSKRIDYYESSQDLFTCAIDNNIKLIVSTLTFANTHYILKDQLKLNRVRSSLRKFKTLVEVASFDDKILELALEEEFKDFEDGIQYYIAIETNCQAIITRNKKDFKRSIIPVLNAAEFVELNKYRVGKGDSHS